MAVQSSFREEGPQQDGRRWIHASFVLVDGAEESLSTLLPPGVDAAAHTATRATEIEARAAQESV